jgi:Family of unknown function (DUF6155)
MTQPNVNINDFKQYLKSRSQEELIADIAELFRKFPAVREYYQIKLHPQEEEEIVAKYKQIIANEFFPVKGLGKARLSVAKQAIIDYQKLSQKEASLIDIMLFYVEQGVKFTNTYGDIDEQFYLSLEGIYEKAIAIIKKTGLKDIFKPRCQAIIDNSSGIEGSFNQNLRNTYQNIL